jgi:non-ribosomal peptide synthetase component F
MAPRFPVEASSRGTCRLRGWRRVVFGWGPLQLDRTGAAVKGRWASWLCEQNALVNITSGTNRNFMGVMSRHSQRKRAPQS